MAYMFWEKKKPIEAIKMEVTYSEAVRGGWKAEKLRTALHQQGIKYRWQDLLSDFRTAKAIEMSKTGAGRARAEWWVTKVIEPIRKEHKTNFKGAIDIWEKLKEKAEEWEDLGDREEEAWEAYEGIRRH